MKRKIFLGLLFSVSTVLADDRTEIFYEQQIDVSKSGGLLAISWPPMFYIFELGDGTKKQAFDSKAEDPLAFKFSSDGSKLLSTGWEKVTIWDAVKGKPIGLTKTRDNADCAGFSPDGKLIYFEDQYSAFGEKQLVITDIKMNHSTKVIRNVVDCNQSDDYSLLSVSHYIKHEGSLFPSEWGIYVYDLNANQELAKLMGDQATAYDSDMFFFDENRKLLVRDFSRFHIWDLVSQSVEESWDSQMDVDEIAVASNQVLLTDDNQIRLWHLLDGPRPVSSPQLPKDHVITSVGLSSDGQIYAIASQIAGQYKAKLSIFDTSDDKFIHGVEIDSGVKGMKFTNDGKLLILDSFPVYVIDLISGKIQHELSQ